MTKKNLSLEDHGRIAAEANLARNEKRKLERERRKMAHMRQIEQNVKDKTRLYPRTVTYTVSAYVREDDSFTEIVEKAFIAQIKIHGNGYEVGGQGITRVGYGPAKISISWNGANDEQHYLKLARLHCGYTQNEVADRAKMSRSRYANIERGKIRPNRKDQHKIVLVLELNEEMIWPTPFWTERYYYF